MPVIEFEGKTTEEAIENACNQLHVASDELKFEILSTGSSGIFGIGVKKAKIKVVIEEKIQKNSPEKSVDSEILNTKPKSDEKEKFRELPPKEVRSGVFEKRNEQRAVGEDSYKEKSGYLKQEERKEIPLAPTVPGPGEEVSSESEDEIMTLARESLQGILKRMDIKAEVSVARIKERVILTVIGENCGLLIGKKGATLDAFQFLVNKIVNRERTEKTRVIVDTEKYRERRHQSLIDLANRMADKAKKSRRPVTISQLSAHDRRVVHLALQGKTGLRTRSRGDGPYKSVIIVPGAKRNFHKNDGHDDRINLNNERPYGNVANMGSEEE